MQTETRADPRNETGTSADLDRRRFLKRAATVAWAAPTIITVLSSPAYGQTSCPSGDNLGAACSATTLSCNTATGGCVCCAAGTANAGRCGFLSTALTGNPCAANGTNGQAMASCCQGQCGTTGNTRTACRV